MPKTKNLNVNQSFRIDKNSRDLFQRTYPYCMSRFIQNAIKFALLDREFFERVYFTPFEEDK